MPKIQAYAMRDMTGGLNLRADAFELSPNESPDLNNVSISPRGGFELRGGINELTAAGLGRQVVTAWTFFPSSSTAHLMACDSDGTVQYLNAGVWTDVPKSGGVVDFSAGTKVRACTFKNVCYMVAGNVDGFRWSGSGDAEQFGTFAFNDDLENPTTVGTLGELPRARYITSWMGSMWVADTWESGVNYPNRVRWSHPNFPEDWVSTHYIDIDPGKDHDGITALVPLEDVLLVFKRSSVHVITGNPPASLATRPLTYEAGALSQDAVIATDLGVYFYDPIEGVFQVTEQGLTWAFEALHPALKDGRLSLSTADQVMLGWGNRRLWVACPYDGETTRTTAFVLDPTLGGRRSPGAWTKYTFRKPLGPFIEWTPPAAQYRFMAAANEASVDDGEMVLLDQPVAYDRYGLDDEEEHIDSHYFTSWVDLGVSAAPKRWKRPEVVIKAGVEATITVKGYRDYDAATVRRTFQLSSAGFGNYLQWGSGSAVNKWDQNKWAPAGRRLNEIERGAPLGTGKAVALKFIGPTANVDWGVNQISFKYIPKKIRN